MEGFSATQGASETMDKEQDIEPPWVGSECRQRRHFQSFIAEQ